MNDLKNMSTKGSQRTALITGVSGQDGSYLSELLLSKGYRVVGTHKSLVVKQNVHENTSLLNIAHLLTEKDFVLEYGDVLEPASLWKLVHQYKPVEIYNLAAQSHVNLSFKSSEITSEVNALGTLTLLNILLEAAPTARFFQSSSSDMYGDNPATVLNETSAFEPNTPYGCSKLFAHNMVKIYRNTYQLHASCGICFNHESPRRSDNFATQKIAKGVAAIKRGLQDKLMLGNLEIERDWGHARDYVEAMWLMLQQDKPGDYVIATGKSHPLKYFVEKVFHHAGLDMNKHVVVDPKLYRKYDKNKITGDPSKIRKELGWESKTSFDALASEMYENALKTLK